MINLKNFKHLSLLEGISLLLLYFFAMPMKYIFSNPIYVKHIGMIHGILFVIYVLFTLILLFYNKINFKRFIIFNVLSMIPFGFCILEKRYLKNKNENINF